MPRKGLWLNDDGEVVVHVADGWSLRSGVIGGAAPSALLSGDYVRLCRPDGSEYQYWDSEEWKVEPTLVMGAILNAAAGLRMAVDTDFDGEVDGRNADCPGQGG